MRFRRGRTHSKLRELEKEVLQKKISELMQTVLQEYEYTEKVMIGG